jgi:WD40 repeat protein
VKGLSGPGEPPGKSAYWTAMHAVEEAVTREFATDTTDPELEDDAIDLSFLRPSPVPGRIGRLGDFEVIRAIGKGGMGLVLHAFDPHLQRDVAIKVLDPHLASNATARQRFCREARSAAAVTHDNLVTIYQVDEDPKSNLPYLVMQLVQGESLDKRLARVGQLSVGDAVRIGVQAAAGLAAAHGRGLIHRDIKPGNILLEQEGEKALLTDFGLARAHEDLKLTKTGMVAGTPLYMAPEQANGLDADHRADLFSLGSVLYEALAGKPAFDAKTPLAVLRRIADDKHVPLRQVNPEVPDWLDEIVEGLLRKDPRLRIGSARDLAEMLATHASCAIPALECNPCDQAAKVASTLLKSNKPFRRMATVALAGSFAFGALAGAIGGYWYAPKDGERIVEKPVEKIVEVPVAVDSPNRDVGPEPIGRFASMSGAVWTAVPSADGKNVLVGYESGRVKIWDAATGIAKDIDAHKGPVWGVSYSSDGKKLLTTSDDNYVRVWDVDNDKSVVNLLHPNAVRAAVMQQGGKTVVSGDRSGMIHVWSVDDQAETRRFVHGAAVNALALAPDGLSFASAGSDGKMYLWDIPGTGDRYRIELKNGHRGPVYGLAFSADGAWIASAGWDGTVIIWDARGGEILKQFTAHAEGVWSVDFSACGNYLASGGQDNLVKIWDVSTRDPKSAEKKVAFARHKGTVHSVRFFADGHKLVSGSRDGTALVWDLAAVCTKK